MLRVFYMMTAPVSESREERILFADVAKLILVLNAASRCEPIVSMLPDYALRHFR